MIYIKNEKNDIKYQSNIRNTISITLFQLAQKDVFLTILFA
jgi:hypothetical protein